MNFTKDELVDMVFILGECYKNAVLAARVYGERYPDRRLPKAKAFEKLKQRFIATGYVRYGKRYRIKRLLTEENELAVLNHITDNSTVSVRNLSNQIDMSDRSIREVLKKHHYHPNHVQKHQELLPADFQSRMLFCEWTLNKIQQDPNFYSRVLWTDESTFHNSGLVNRRNFHYYADYNPRQFRQCNRQHRWTLNVWGGILGTRVIGPFFFEGNLNGGIYLDFLDVELPQLLEDVPLNVRQNQWFQYDGAPAYSTDPVTYWLNENYPDRWIGRRGRFPWPARSPDLTPLDYFLWGVVKDKVLPARISLRYDIKNRIREAFRLITIETLQGVENRFTHNIHLCLENFGGHFEHLL